jgi:hypothetical protein
VEKSQDGKKTDIEIVDIKERAKFLNVFNVFFEKHLSKPTKISG